MTMRTLLSVGLFALATATAVQATPPSKPGLGPATDGHGPQQQVTASSIEPLFANDDTVLAAGRLLPESKPGLGPTPPMLAPRSVAPNRAASLSAASLQPESKPGLGPDNRVRRAPGSVAAGNLPSSQALN